MEQEKLQSEMQCSMARRVRHDGASRPGRPDGWRSDLRSAMPGPSADAQPALAMETIVGDRAVLLFRTTRAALGQFSLIWRTLVSFHNRQKEPGQAGAEREVERNDSGKKGH